MLKRSVSSISEDRENSICSHLVIFESGSLDDLCDAEDQETEGHEDDHQSHQEGQEAHWEWGNITQCVDRDLYRVFHNNLASL